MQPLKLLEYAQENVLEAASLQDYFKTYLLLTQLRSYFSLGKTLKFPHKQSSSKIC